MYNCSFFLPYRTCGQNSENPWFRLCSQRQMAVEFMITCHVHVIGEQFTNQNKS